MLKRIKDSILDIFTAGRLAAAVPLLRGGTVRAGDDRQRHQFSGLMEDGHCPGLRHCAGGGDLFPHVPDRPDGGIQAVEVAAGLRHRPVPAAEKTPLGIENNGNRAWLGIRGFPANIQPAEIVKLTFSSWCSAKQLVGR